MIDLGEALGRALSCAFPVPGSALAQELAEERAAIMEHDGGLTREEAEQLAGLNMRPAGSQLNYNSRKNIDEKQSATCTKGAGPGGQ